MKTDRDRLLELVDALEGRPVLLLADLVADVFLTGSPKRISREAPVLILSLDEERLVPGGGANAVANVFALGGRPLPLGVVGDDSRGRGLLDAFRQSGLDTDGILVSPGYRTPTKTRVLGGARHSIKQQIVRFDVEDTVELSSQQREALLAVARAAPSELRVAVLSDYGYGVVGPDAAAALREVLPPECILLCDSRFRLPELKGLDGATPNEEEAEAILGAPLGEEPEEAAAAAQELRRRLSLAFVLVTRGSSGMILADRLGSAMLPTHGSDQVADVTGAGDTVIATFALALAAGATPLEAAHLANYAGGVVVFKSGTATLDRDELAQAVRSDPTPVEQMSWVSC